MTVTRSDVSTNKPATTNLVTVASGETVYAETENNNNLAMMNPLIVAFNWIIDSGVELSGTNSFTALQTFSSGLKVGQIDPLTTNGDIILNVGTGAVYKNSVTTGTKYLTRTEIDALVVASGDITDGDKGDITISGTGTVFTIDNSAVTTAKINDLAVTTGKINDLAATTAKINDLAVTTGKINDLAVTTGKINDLAVTTGKIADANVTPAKLSFTFSTKTTTYNPAVNRDWLLCNTSSAAFTVTFPASASTGDMIMIVDLNNTFDTNNLTIAPNGLKIEAQTGDLVLNIKGFTGLFYYVDATTGWKRIG